MRRSLESKHALAILCVRECCHSSVDLDLYILPISRSHIPTTRLLGLSLLSGGSLRRVFQHEKQCQSMWTICRNLSSSQSNPENVSEEGGREDKKTPATNGARVRLRYRAREADDQKRKEIDTMLRIDHAGEYAAVRIYQGQLAALSGTASPARPIIEEMLSQEVVHLRNLERVLPERRARPSALLPLWDVAGYALGYGSALLGEKAAMACTTAVETVITEHYDGQIRTLSEDRFAGEEEELKAMIKQHRDDEEEHHEIGMEHHAKQVLLPLSGLGHIVHVEYH